MRSLNAVGLSLILGSLASATQAGPWAARVVHGLSEGEPVYETGIGDPLTFGPYHTNPLWSRPASLLGKPNTIDYDDLNGWGPVEGGFAGGPMRHLSLVWSAWQYGSGDPAHLGQRPGWLDGRRPNGVGLRAGAQIVVEFDEPVLNNSDDGGAYHWGIDFIVHGNAFFAADSGITGDTSMDAVVLGSGSFSEPVTVSVAQQASGPWYTFVRTADGMFPTQPWAWDSGSGVWTDQEQDWGKPVDPSLSGADFAGLTAAEGIELYAGSAGGTPYDLDWLVDGEGEPAELGWVRYVRVSDPNGLNGEVCGIADVPAGPACTAADLTAPYGVLDLADISAFVAAFVDQHEPADLAPPAGVFDLADISAFIGSFNAGCP